MIAFLQIICVNALFGEKFLLVAAQQSDWWLFLATFFLQNKIKVLLVRAEVAGGEVRLEGRLFVLR